MMVKNIKNMFLEKMKIINSVKMYTLIRKVFFFFNVLISFFLALQNCDIQMAIHIGRANETLSLLSYLSVRAIGYKGQDDVVKSMEGREHCNCNRILTPP